MMKPSSLICVCLIFSFINCLNFVNAIDINQLADPNIESFHYLALKDNENKPESTKSEFKYLFEVDPEANESKHVEKRDLSSIHQQPPLLHQFQKKNMVRIDTYELDSQKKRQLVANPSQSLQNIEREDDMDKSKGICLYVNVKAKIGACFEKNSDCNAILDCIAALNLVETCKKYEMFTPTIWIVNIYNILKSQGFCSIPLQCELNPNDNEYLRRLDNIMKFTHEYGPVYLDRPKFDNKKYCSKSHNLISNVIDSIDTIDNCFDSTIINQIRIEIEDSTFNILDRNCPYCISANLNFDECLEERYFTCNESFKCITDKIELYKCNHDPDTTALTLITSFLRNITFLCDLNAHEKNISFEEIRDWLYGIDLCMNERHFLGLTYNEAPPNIDLCHDLDETFKCIYNSHKNIYRQIPQLKTQFDIFANNYNRLQRSCELLSLTRTSQHNTPLKQITQTNVQFQNNSEQTVIEDNKNYYHQIIVRSELNQIINWVNVDTPAFAPYSVKRDHDLSKNYLKATIVKLKFKFPYYGHMLDQVVVATGGFLYVGSLMNPLITKAQYIAPLMANFDPTLNDKSIIKYVDNTTHFICTWENLLLQDQKDNGEYTFQVVLNNEGKVYFNYKKIPSLNISNSNHTVKIGISDAYIFYKLLSTSKIEYTIVQYHVINILPENVKTGNSVIFYMLKNCLQQKTCEECVKGITNFKCIWCPMLQRCSDTIDRFRQEWVELSCPMDASTQSNNTCISNRRTNPNVIADSDRIMFDTTARESDGIRSVLSGIFVTIIISMTLTTVAWIFYAYKNPNSASGIWLIEHRPSRLISHITSRFSKSSSSLSRFENPVA